MGWEVVGGFSHSFKLISRETKTIPFPLFQIFQLVFQTSDKVEKRSRIFGIANLGETACYIKTFHSSKGLKQTYES